MEKQFIVIADGDRFIGPFSTKEEAHDYGFRHFEHFTVEEFKSPSEPRWAKEQWSYEHIINREG